MRTKQHYGSQRCKQSYHESRAFPFSTSSNPSGGVPPRCKVYPRRSKWRCFTNSDTRSLIKDLSGFEKNGGDSTLSKPQYSFLRQWLARASLVLGESIQMIRNGGLCYPYNHRIL